MNDSKQSVDIPEWSSISLPLAIIAILVFAIGVCGAAAYGFAQTRDDQGFQVPDTIVIPAGDFIFGSSPAEREAAYRLDEQAYGHSNTRNWGWYDREEAPGTANLPEYEITKTPITNLQYAAFVEATGHRVPVVDKATWDGYGLIHPFERSKKHHWTYGPEANRYQQHRASHPVVMVSYDDATAYANWLSDKTGQNWRLPTSREWEKATRGTDGRRFPWGDSFDADLNNTHDTGPFDTMPVGSFPLGTSPFGLLDASGQVFEWTSERQRAGRHFVRGGSWDDRGCGICRPAAKHGRRDGIKHILVGFRLVRDAG